MTNACPFCGRPVPDSSARQAKQGGQARVYCDDQCRRAYHHTAQVARLLELAIERMTPERWARYRGDLWALLNSRAWNRGVPRNAAKQPRAPWKEPSCPPTK